MSYDSFTRERWAQVWGGSEVEYDPASDVRLRDSLHLILRHRPEPEDGRFLEPRCGPPANALNLARLGAHVAGVDLAPGPSSAREQHSPATGSRATSCSGT